MKQTLYIQTVSRPASCAKIICYFSFFALTVHRTRPKLTFRTQKRPCFPTRESRSLSQLSDATRNLRVGLSINQNKAHQQKRFSALAFKATDWERHSMTNINRPDNLPAGRSRSDQDGVPSPPSRWRSRRSRVAGSEPSPDKPSGALW